MTRLLLMPRLEATASPSVLALSSDCNSALLSSEVPSFSIVTVAVVVVLTGEVTLTLTARMLEREEVNAFVSCVAACASVPKLSEAALASTT